MQSPDRFSRRHDGGWASFWAGVAICSTLAYLLSTSILYGHPLLAAAFTAAAPAPAAPSGLTATAVSNSRIDLVWTDNSSDENGFKIEIKLGAAGTYTQIATPGANVTTYASTGLDENTQYFYRVRAYNADGNSAYSADANATTRPDPPAAPNGLTAATASKSQINLMWTDNASNETGFKIERKLNTAIIYTQIATVGANVTSYANTGLAANTGYSYRVLAYNTGGNSNYSNVASATTLPNTPAAPSLLAATAVSNSRIDLSWKDNATTEMGFIIERKAGVSDIYTVIDTVSANVVAYSSTGLAGNIQYFYKVSAYNNGGSSAYSNEANATTLPDPPAVPVNLTATVINNEQINLVWADNASNEDGFIIEIKADTAGIYTEIAAVSANVTTYSSTGLEASTQYFYRVRGYNTGGNSAYSNEASATTLPDPPTGPNNLTAITVSDTQINLAWTDNAGNEDGFKIERKLNSAIIYTQIATVGANVTSYANTGLTATTAYSYRVRAYNTSVNSSYSNIAGATTLMSPPAAPSALVATALNKIQINLAWKDNAKNEFGFTIERKTPQSGAYAEIATLDSNVTSYASTGLTAGTMYFYRVRAFNSTDSSSYSNEANATTLPNAPSAPSNLTITGLSNAQITFTWTDNSTNETLFKIERKLGSAITFTQIATVGANATSFTDTTLTANTEYFYRVRAYNTGGHSAYSNQVNATTLPNLPAAPSGLTATAANKSQINLLWTDNATNETGFKIESKIGTAGTFSEFAIVGANVTSFADTSLNANTQYFYRVRAYNAGGNSAYSNDGSAKTLPFPPSKPINLTATMLNSGQINLAWADKSTNESGFRVERKTGAAGAYAQIATVGANVINYANTGLLPNTQYFYRVRAYNSGGNSAYSNDANATTLPSLPQTPSNLTAATMSNSQIDLAWADSANNEEGYKIERKTEAAGAYAEIATVGANVTSYSNTGLTANTQFFYQVRAYNAGGNSAYSNDANATTHPNIPSAPSNLAVTTVNKNQINLAWADSANNEDGFKIERKTGTAGTYAEIATVGANVTSYANTGLTANTQFFYQVRAYNAGGNSAYSNVANAATHPNPPQAPSNLTATAAGVAQINLTWMDNTTIENGVKIDRKIGATGTYAEIATVGANVTSYANTGLSPNTKYFYLVRAYNLGGNSGYSNAANATTQPNAPKAPGNLTATAVSNSQINLAWADSATNETGFKIERKIGAAGTYAEITTVGANVMIYSNTGLATNTQYFYRVRAYNSGGNSAYSNDANATTQPLIPKAPGNLTAAVLGVSQINLAWADSATNETGFKIERKIGAAGTYAEITTVGANVMIYSNTGLAANTQYFYRVRAYNSGGNSAYSNDANATTQPLIPKAPGNLTAAVLGVSQINLAWADSATNETGFKIERKIGAAGTYAEMTTVGANVMIYSNTGLAANTQYFYRVRAYNSGGNSAYSNDANATTQPLIPKAPGNLTTAVLGVSQINLAWADSATNETGFKIERKMGAAGTFAEMTTVGANVMIYSNTGLIANTQYFYRVRAYNAGGNSAYSNDANASTLPNIPKAPGNLTAAAVSNSQINLAWADSATNETGFKIERKIGAAGTFAEMTTVGANVMIYSNTGLIATTQYFYRVRAYNAGGNSAYSNDANASTLPNIPKAPGNLTAAAVSVSQIDLAWADSATNETGFKIERKPFGGTYAEIGTAGANVTSYSNTGLTATTQYFYRVRAFNTGGNSAYSNEANATTLNSGANLALNKPVMASSTDSSSAPSRAVDGNAITFWRSGLVSGVNPIAWLSVELVPSSAVFIGRAVVNWNQNYFAQEYELQVSTDGTNWTTVHSNTAGAIGVQDFTFTATLARFVRLYMKKNEKSNYRVLELEIYTSSGVAKNLSHDAGAAKVPASIALAPNYPNPFSPLGRGTFGNSATYLNYELPKAGHVLLTIYNTLGQEVKRLVDQQQPAGYHHVAWNGRDQKDKPVPSGVYHYRLEVDGFVATKKMLMTK